MRSTKGLYVVLVPRIYWKLAQQLLREMIPKTLASNKSMVPALHLSKRRLEEELKSEHKS